VNQILFRILNILAQYVAVLLTTMDCMSDRPPHRTGRRAGRAKVALVHARRARRELWLALRLSLDGLPGLTGRSLLWAPGLLIAFVARRLLEVLLAILLIFEEWGWKPLSRAMAWLARFRLIARLERVVADLPPYGALAALVGPSIVIIPLKLLALYLITTGHAVLAGLLFIGAKLVGTAVLARLYMLTSPKLMQILWFARLHDRVMPWKDALFAKIRVSWAWRYGRIVKHKAALRFHALAAKWRPRLRAQAEQLSARVRALLAGGRGL
jgi:hypothetical protein